MTLILGAAYMAGGAARASEETAHIVNPDRTVPFATASIQSANAGFAEQFRRAAAQGLAGANLVKAAQPFHGKAQGRDYDCLATAVYYEARGEGARGQEAVAQVILNRVRHPAFPKTVCAVVFQDCQFSFACDGSMRRGKEAAAWDRARSVAAKALAGAVMAEVGNSTHFHARRVAPGWGNLVRVASVGSHVFYRFGGHAGRAALGGGMRTASLGLEAEAPAEPVPAYTILGPASRGETAGLQRISTAAPAIQLSTQPVKLQPAPVVALAKPAAPKIEAPATAPAPHETAPAPAAASPVAAAQTAAAS
ncbi:MAG TPA: cell wall hydrolase [Caulobacteraceae bacterium]|jgi:spore germination cell wall hydrolase CwlJ-like protein